MGTSLIGAHRTWNGPPLSPRAEENFAAALGIADGRPAQMVELHGTLLAASGKNRGWRPHSAPCGAGVLFAGRIENRRQLAAELGISAQDDGALYAAGFSAWGHAIDLRAVGFFAAIVVRPQGDVLHLSRSPIHAPPLHYHYDAERFIVASFSHAIFATDEVKRRVDRQKVADALLLNRMETVRSWFEDVVRLPCGHRATVSRDGITIESYYDPAALPEIRLKDDREYEEATLALLQEGIAAALDGSMRPAVCLSGGYDSQAITALAARCRPGKPIRAFTGVPEAGWDGIVEQGYIGNERSLVEALAAEYPEIQTHWVDAAELSLNHKIEPLFLLSGMSPQNVTNLCWAFEISSRARQAGCDVILDGMGGNLTFSFSGQGALPALLRRGRLLSLWRDASGFNPARSKLANVAIQGVLPFAPRWLFKRIMALHPDWTRTSVSSWSAIAPDFAEEMQAGERSLAQGADPLFRVPTSTRATRLEMIMNYDGDGADITQACQLLDGLEYRHPALYRPLVEFCFGIPDDQYLRRGQKRWLANRMLKGLVPEKVRNNTLKGLQTADWHLRLYRQRNEMIAEIDRLRDDPAVTEILDLDRMRRALEELPSSTPVGDEADFPQTALPRGLAMASYIRFMEGSNR